MSFKNVRAAQKCRVLILAMGMIGLGLWSHFSMAEAPATVFGEYVGSSCPPKTEATTCVLTKASDHVSILHDQETEAKINVKIVFDKGHICALEGRAVWSEGSFMLHADGLDPTKPCQLLLQIKGSELTLEDAGGLCREVYCGARGTFEGARFKKRP